MIEIKENIISPTYQREIENIIFSKHFKWCYFQHTVNPNTVPREGFEDTFQFIHRIYDEEQTSFMFDFLKPLIYTVEDSFNVRVKNILRMKCNLLLNVFSNNIIHPPHIDFNNPKFLSLIYYVNDSDGDTFMYESGLEQANVIKRVSPVKGTAVVFNSNIYHSSSTPIINKHRSVINLIFESV